MRSRWQAQFATILAVETRDALYGRKERPLGRTLRLDWVRVCRRYRRSGALLAADIVRVARALGEELRLRGPLVATPEVDQVLRVELAARLRAEAKRLGRPRLTAAQRREGRIRTLAKG